MRGYIREEGQEQGHANFLENCWSRFCPSARLSPGYTGRIRNRCRLFREITSSFLAGKLSSRGYDAIRAHRIGREARSRQRRRSSSSLMKHFCRSFNLATSIYHSRWKSADSDLLKEERNGAYLYIKCLLNIHFARVAC